MSVKKEYCENCEVEHIVSDRDNLINPDGDVLEKGILDSVMTLIHTHAKARPNEDILQEDESKAYISLAAKSYTDVMYFMARSLISTFPDNPELVTHFLQSVSLEQQEVSSDLKAILEIHEKEMGKIQFASDIEGVLH